MLDESPATGTGFWSRSVRLRGGVEARQSTFGDKFLHRLRAWHLLPLIAVLLVIGVGAASDRWRAEPVSSFAMPQPGFGPMNYTAAMIPAERQIALGRERMVSAPGDWTSHEILARGLMARASLTGSYSDLAEARLLLDDAMAIAPKRSGPIVVHATLALSTHRLSALADDLSILESTAIPLEQAQRAAMAGLAGDIAFYRGDMVTAAAQYRRGAQLHAGPLIDYRLAVMAAAEGRFAVADAAIARTVIGDRKHSPQTLAQSALRLGGNALARGQWEAAEQWFARADMLFPGYWLTAAHRAQSEALTGDPAKAAGRMAAIAERSNSAEVMDAAAMLYRHLGDRTNSQRWAARSRSQWAERLQQLPEAAYGHALEHELAFGTPERALDLAQKNVAQRPYGEARLLLASALLMNNRPGNALAEIARAEKSGWRSAPLYAVKAEAAALAGKPKLSAEAREQAKAINPRIFDPRTPLVWFAHG